MASISNRPNVTLEMHHLIALCILLCPLGLFAALTPSAYVSREYVDVVQARVGEKYAAIRHKNGKKELIPVSSLRPANLDWFFKIEAADPLRRGDSSVKVVTTIKEYEPKNTIVTSEIKDGVETVQLCAPNVFRNQTGGTCMFYARVHLMDIAGYYVNNGTINKSINGAPPHDPWSSPNYVAGLTTIVTNHTPTPILHDPLPYGDNFEWARQQLRLGRPILAALPSEIWQALPSGYLAERQWSGGKVGHQIVVNGFTYNPETDEGTFHIVNTWEELPEFDLKTEDARRGILVFEQSVSPYGHVPDDAEQERLAKELKVISISLLRKAGSYNLYKVVTNQGAQHIMAPDKYTAQRIVEDQE